MSVYDEIAKIEDRSLRGYAAQLLFRVEKLQHGGSYPQHLSGT